MFSCEVVPFGNFVPKVVYHSPCCGFWDSIVFVFSCFFPVSVCYPIFLGRVISSVFPPIPTTPCHILQELVYISHCIKIFIYTFKLFFFLKILQSIKFTTQNNNNTKTPNSLQKWYRNVIDIWLEMFDKIIAEIKAAYILKETNRKVYKIFCVQNAIFSSKKS